ncbi:MAG: flagellar basal body-associated FliL family protein [Oscillospiraceae bacterium]|jgi:flagellar basal body-associated protein FliL|nr:flagellar basal body-associated FliL family protein [Oscillospiraceae bacterium]
MKKVISIIVAIIIVVGGITSCKEVAPSTIVTSYYSPGDFFVTNVKNSKKLFKGGVVLIVESVDEAASAEFLARENAVIRDKIIFIIRDMEEVDIASAEGSEALRERIRSELCERLDTTEITGILFNDYVMQ